MKFTQIPPTAPGDYAWRYNASCSYGLVQVTDLGSSGLWCYSTLNDGGCSPKDRGGQWCLLKPAVKIEELKKIKRSLDQISNRLNRFCAQEEAQARVNKATHSGQKKSLQ